MAKSKKSKTKTLRNSKLRNTFLFWFLIISVIPLSIVSFISFNIAHKAFRDNAVDSLINTAIEKKEFLESYFLKRVTDLDFQSQEIANVKFLNDLKKSFIESGLPIEKYAKSYEHAKLMVKDGRNLRNFQVSYDYVDVLLLDSEGNCLFSIGNRNREFIGTNMFTGEYADTNLAKACKKSISTGKPYLSDFEFCKSDKNRIDCYIVQAVVDNEGRKIGLIALQIPIYSIDKIMWTSTGLGDTGETYLVGEDLLMRSDSRFSEHSTVLNVRVHTEVIKKWLINEVNTGHTNYIPSKMDILVNMDQSIDKNKAESYKPFNANIYDGYRGISVLGVSANIDELERFGIHWVLLAEIDEKEAFSSLYILRDISLIMIFATVLVVVFISLTVSKLIVNPITKLTNLLPHIAKGDMNTDFKIESRNEIGLLETSFRNMAIDLKQTTVSMDYLKSVFENMYDVLVVVTPDCRIKTVNTQFCNLLDYNLDSVTDKSFNDFFLDSHFLTESELKRFNQYGHIYDLEKTLVAKNRLNIPVLLSVSKMNDKKGVCEGIVCVAKDITDRKHYEEDRETFVKELQSKQIEIERTNKNLKKAFDELRESKSIIVQQEKRASIGLLAAGVAHEINNPIGFISSNINTLGKYVEKFKQFINLQDEAIKQIKETAIVEKLNKNRNKLKLNFVIDDIDNLINESLEGTERVKKIVIDLKNFSRQGDERQEIVDINGCIRSALNIVWNELKYKASLNTKFGNIPLTKCYQHLLVQVFMNMLINAAHAIKERGEITIETWQEGNSILVSILDTGCGISQKNINKVFDPFFTTKDVGKGTGLGMSISYDIIKKHNGFIKVESEEWKWTKFVVEIPIIAK